MFNLFRRNSTKSQLKPPRAPGDTIREKDLTELVAWVSGRGMVEGFVEPETVVNEMSIVFVDDTGDYIRRRIGGPKGIDAVARALDVPIYDVEETGYPQRMRERMKRERILRKRREQAERRKQWEQRNGEA
ncbi:oxidoreductase [Corynebacterium sp. MSK297]|uniref:oxidoreductase n=1 Tax=Corynebacterium sp. MSK297 TaxID=3050221 RepID=UPI0025519B41|nr:oxidoreductase [Corynebacterium sp. MSK297]MDK8845252.1 oxidoreductase [Corynebacterium sp. MSK297]